MIQAKLERTRTRTTNSDSNQTSDRTQTSERNRKPVRQRRTWLRSNRYRSRCRSTCCGGRGCGYGSAGRRGNRGPASDGSRFGRSRCCKPGRNRTRVQRRRSARHKPERHSRSARQRRTWLHSTWARSSCRGPSCDRASRTLWRRKQRTASRGPRKNKRTTSWGGLLFLLGNERELSPIQRFSAAARQRYRRDCRHPWPSFF